MDTPDNWYEGNREALFAEIGAVRSRLEALTDAARDLPEGPPAPIRSPALDSLCSGFRLSEFERRVLVLCAGVELDGAIGPLCASVGGGAPTPTLGLALAAFGDATFAAVTPDAPLRRYELVRLEGSGPLMTRALRIDERVLHYVLGLRHLAEEVAGYVSTEIVQSAPLAASHRELAARIATIWTSADPRRPLPVVVLTGGSAAAKRDVAAVAARALDLSLHSVEIGALPRGPWELSRLSRGWAREAVLSGRALLVEVPDGLETDAAAQRGVLRRLVGAMRAVVMVATPDRIQLPHAVTVEVARAGRAEQRELWRAALGPGSPLASEVDRLVARFDLDSHAIDTIGRRAAESGVADVEAPTHASEASEPGDPRAAFTSLLAACRAWSRPELTHLATRIEPRATWDDIVLPAAQRESLRQLAVHVERRTQVYDDWGFGARSSRGLGISALFSGVSGTGKTMAAEVLAGALGLDLYHIDLSRVVSKYIGETEANLRRVFDAADTGSAILLFDEADALFGKRSEVKDSHDRYANIEVSYLLQRMEAYRGLAILTTNLRKALDAAFLRRLRFVVTFPFPDEDARAEIWRRAFPASTPTVDLDVHKLAKLGVAGGNIRNIALHAAFLAAEAEGPVTMTHLQRAARTECDKLERPASEAVLRQWT